MEISENDRKVEAFIKMLSSHVCNEITGTQEAFNMRDVFYDFIKIYSNNNYRHSYNRIFISLKQIKDNNTSNDESFLMNISVNYEYIEDMLLPPLKDHDQRRYKKVIKFFDHLLLEVSRLNVWLEYERETKEQKQELDQYTEKIQEFNKQMDGIVEGTRDKIAAIQKETSHIKTDFVTILSIFAAIIIGFAGVLGFGGNLMASLGSVVIYKAVFMLLAGGLVLFNGIFVMLHIVAKLTGRSIAHHCPEHINYIQYLSDKEDVSHKKYSCDTCNKKDCGVLHKLKRRFPYTTYFNKVFAYGLFITSIVWILNHGEIGKAVTNDVTYFINCNHGVIYAVLSIVVIVAILPCIYDCIVKRIYGWIANRKNNKSNE